MTASLCLVRSGDSSPSQVPSLFCSSHFCLFRLAKQQQDLAVAGLGGLGHFAVMFGTAQEGLGNDYAPSFDYVLSTIDIAEKMPLADIISTVDINGELHICAMPDDELKFPSRSKKEPQGMLQLAADKGIETWKQVIPMKDVGKGVQAVKESKCRKRKMKCSRTDPCVACTLRGQECVWQDCKPTRSAPQASLRENRLEIIRLSKVVDQLQALVYERDGRYCHPEAPPTPPKYLDPSSPTVSDPGYVTDSSTPSQRPQRGMGAPVAPAPYGMLSSQWAASTGFVSVSSPSYPLHPHQRPSMRELDYCAPSPSSGYNLFRHQPHHHQHASFPSSSTSYPSPHYPPPPRLPATSTSYGWPSPEQARSSTWPVQHPPSDSTAPSAPYHDLRPSSASSSISHRQSDANGQLSRPPRPDHDAPNFPIAQTMCSLPHDLETVEHHQRDATEEDWTQTMVLPEYQQV
ncbi:hypothetical protein JCM1841_004559 [Sporobolomyces salmonicolor]